MSLTTAEALVLYLDTGVAGTSRLVAYIDTGVTGLSRPTAATSRSHGTRPASSRFKAMPLTLKQTGE